MQQRIWILSSLMFILAACGAGPPRVTPTVAPTNTLPPTAIVQNLEPTASPTPIIPATSSNTPTAIPTNTASPSPVPSDTASPTVTLTGTQTPTNTASPTATATQTFTPTATVTASETFTPSPTASDTATLTPTITATGTQTPTATLTLTPTLTPSNTATVTASATNTDVPTPTPLVLDTNTPTPSPSFTPTLTPLPPSLTPTLTSTPTSTFSPTPTATNTPNLLATENAELLLTRAAASDTPERPPTFTPVAQASPTNTLIPPTLDVTPIVITATPNTGVIPTPIVTVPTVAGTPIIDLDAPTATATLENQITPSPFPAEQIPATVVVEQRDDSSVFVPSFNNTTTAALSFNVGPGAFFFNGQAIESGNGVRLFVANPADPNSFARTDANGVLTFAAIGSGEGSISSSPFVPGFAPASAAENQDFVSFIAWSPNGQRLAFIIQPAPGTDNADGGVWFWDAASGGAFVLLHDCPFEGFTSCSLTSRPVNNWQSISVEWAPNSAQVVITVNLTTEGRQAIFIADMNFASSRGVAPPFIRWDNAQWLNNGELLVSGRAPDGGSRISRYDIASGAETIVYNASANGIFIADAVQRSNGQIIGIGRPGGAFDGAYRMYRIENGVATEISGDIGGAVPQRIAWSTNYSSAVVTVGGQQLIVNTNNGGISGTNTSGSVQVGGGVSNNPTGAPLQDPPPSGVVAGSRYSAGQQIQYVGDVLRNMRSQPNLSASPVDFVSPNEFVTVLAGPYEANGFEWWQVSNRNGTRAWISVRTLEGFSVFNP